MLRVNQTKSLPSWNIFFSEKGQVTQTNNSEINIKLTEKVVGQRVTGGQLTVLYGGDLRTKWWRARTRTFQAEGRASTGTVWWKGTWRVWGKGREPCQLDHRTARQGFVGHRHYLTAMRSQWRIENRNDMIWCILWDHSCCYVKNEIQEAINSSS